jgi:hypothetical protein
MNQQEALNTEVSCQFHPIPINSIAQVIPPNPRRVALIISGTGGAGYVAPSKDLLNPAVGVNIHGFNIQNAQPLVLSRVLHGALVTVAWFAYGSAGGDEVVVCEVLEK